VVQSEQPGSVLSAGPLMSGIASLPGTSRRTAPELDLQGGAGGGNTGRIRRIGEGEQRCRMCCGIDNTCVAVRKERPMCSDNAGIARRCQQCALHAVAVLILQQDEASNKKSYWQQHASEPSRPANPASICCFRLAAGF